MLILLNKLKTSCILINIALAISLAAWSGISQASENLSDLSLPSAKYFTQDTKAFLLALNETDGKKNITETITPAAEFNPPLFSASKAHQFLGIGTVLMAGLTALSHPDECEGSCSDSTPRETNGTHAKLAKATVAMAAATIASGLYAHWDDFSLEDGISDPDNLHVLLGVSGAALMAYAVSLSANSDVKVNHASFAEAGALGMLIAIKLNW